MSKLQKYSLLILFSFIVNSTAAQAASDPMRPPGNEPSSVTSKKAPSSKKTTRYHLSSIRITPTQRSAIINGKRVIRGQHVGDAKVTAIDANKVTLQQAGKTIKISLLPLSIKTPVEATQP